MSRPSTNPFDRVLWAMPGRPHRIWLFVMVLPASRHMFIRPVLPLHQHA
jgi:hypothetical protein